MFKELQRLGMYMMATRQLNSDLVENFCSLMISLYLSLCSKG